MTIEVLKSKIHRVTVTEANLNYVGSVTIDEELLEAANILAGEIQKVVSKIQLKIFSCCSQQVLRKFP